MQYATVSHRASISSSAICSKRSSTNHGSRVTSHVFSTPSSAILLTSPVGNSQRSRAMSAPLIAEAGTLLKPDGILVLELGYNSAEHVSQLLNTPGWSEVTLTNDLAGIKRVASARRTSISTVST